jgi:NitT/TauT family transport system substrate-binding protein
MKFSLKNSVVITAVAAVAAAPVSVSAADKVRLINSTKVVFEMEHAYAAKENGVFDNYGLDVDIIHGSGGAATLQTIITASQDVAFGVGVLAVLGAYSKGAPVRIIGSTKRGTGDLYFYVKSGSSIQKLTDLTADQELVYSRPGSTTHLTTLFLKDALGLKAKLVSVGGPSGSRTQVMSGQVATGWSVFPLNGKLLREKKIRIIGTGTQAAGLNGVTIRVVAANSNWLEKNRGVAQRVMAAMIEGQTITYSSEKQQRAYAKRWKLDYNDVKSSDKFVPLSGSTYLPVGKVDKLNAMALKYKRIKKLLTKEQLHELVHPLGNKPI